MLLEQVVEEGRSLSAVLAKGLLRLKTPQERALCQELCYGTLRWYHRLDAVADQLLARKLKPKDRVLKYLILVGLYQLLYLRVPSHAAVDLSVGAVRELNRAWSSGMVNAVLRTFLREQAAILETVDAQESCRVSHPQWLLDAIRKAWGERWSVVVEANNQRPPMSLRVNLARISRDEYLQQLTQQGITARPLPHAPSGLLLAQAEDVARLPGFAAGQVSVQDHAAQLAAPLLNPLPGQRVLDACAAPGGKTGHLLEYQPQLAELVAVDVSVDRVDLIAQNLSRLGMSATLLSVDVGETEQWWDGKPFDAILLDAPCTGSGVVRRNPDIKVLRRPEDIAGLATQQARLLHALWPLLKPGGRLLYATCSILPAENSEQMQSFLATTADARAVSMDACAWGTAQPVGRQVLPGEDDMDGFYYALLEKIGAQ